MSVMLISTSNARKENHVVPTAFKIELTSVICDTKMELK